MNFASNFNLVEFQNKSQCFLEFLKFL
jgi:hypothetical protein